MSIRTTRTVWGVPMYGHGDQELVPTEHRDDFAYFSDYELAKKIGEGKAWDLMSGWELNYEPEEATAILGMDTNTYVNGESTTIYDNERDYYYARALLKLNEREREALISKTREQLAE